LIFFFHSLSHFCSYLIPLPLGAVSGGEHKPLTCKMLTPVPKIPEAGEMEVEPFPPYFGLNLQAQGHFDKVEVLTAKRTPQLRTEASNALMEQQLVARLNAMTPERRQQLLETARQTDAARQAPANNTNNSNTGITSAPF
jgi:hypothetical protein